MDWKEFWKKVVEFLKKLDEKTAGPRPGIEIDIRRLKPEDIYKPPFSIDFKNTRPWTWIVLHHSYSPDSQKTNDWKGIWKYHTSWRYEGNIITEEVAKQLIKKGTKGVESPWPTIGYHFGIEFVDNVLQYQVGCPLSQIGYHSKGFNERAIGICMVGNYGGNFDGSDGQKPDSNMIQMIAKLMRFLMWKYDIPVQQVLGHRETYKFLGRPVVKTCPGTKVDMEKIRQLLV